MNMHVVVFRASWASAGTCLVLVEGLLYLYVVFFEGGQRDYMDNSVFSSRFGMVPA